jgi:hypothetical protein
MPLPHGWSSVVSHGVVRGRPAAYLRAGNFRFRERPNLEAGPHVPPGRVLISIGDFPPLGPWARWRHVDRLRLPDHAARKRSIHWQVRFAQRAVSVEVQFGSKPDARIRALVNARLRAVHRLS